MNKLSINDFKNVPKNTSGIYKITNTVNNRFYIGQAGCFVTRWKRHLKNLKRGNHYNIFFQRDFCKNYFDKNNLRFEILEKCSNSKEYLNHVEQKYLDLYWDNNETCYNISKNATSPNKGKKHSDATKKKISNSQKGKMMSINSRELISKANKGVAKGRKIEFCVKVYQYDSNGNFIKKYDALIDAANEINKTRNKHSIVLGAAISKIAKKNIDLNKKNKTYMAYGFVWLHEYAGENIKVIKNKIYTVEERKDIGNRSKIANNKPSAQIKFKKRISSENPNSRKIKQYSVHGNLIKIWHCINDAIKECNINRTTIYKSCKRQTKNARRFVWRYFEDEF